MKKYILYPLYVICTLAAILVGCGKQDVSFQTLEDARAQARENAEFNAKKWRADTKLFSDANLIPKGDSSQAPACPQGDGWATIEIVNASGQKLESLKCSTVSLSVGCRTSKDFKESPYANEDGVCQPVTKVPHPLPKLTK
jgi:hypothetical protein